MSEQLEQIQNSVAKAKHAPEQEAEELLQMKDKVISTLEEELELARAGNDRDQQNMERVVEDYSQALRNQELLRQELTKALQDFRAQTISRDELSNVVTYQKLSQYESGGLLLGQFLVRDRLVKIYEGDITDMTADVMVSSDDNYLSMGGGVSKRIRTMGGKEIYEEAQCLVPLSLGDVVATTAGALSSRIVLHAVVLDFDKDTGPSEEVIKTVVRRCIDKAAAQRFRSIAFPLFGTGMGRFPAAVALEIVLSAVLSNFSTASHTVVEAVVVIYDSTVARAINVEAIIRGVESKVKV